MPFIHILILLIPPTFCISIGMARAFFSGRKSGKKGLKSSDAIWTGFAKGNTASVISFFLLSILVGGFSLFTHFFHPFKFGEMFLLALSLWVLFAVVTVLIGLILFTSSAFFGYSIGKQTYVAKLLQKEANKTDEERLNDLKNQQFSRPHL